MIGVSLLLLWIVPSVAGSLYVKPNEISLERPYIASHIEATRAAYGLSTQIREVEMHTNPNAAIDTSKNKALLDNVRLWDWRPFHDTVTQMQALRPYYVFHEPRMWIATSSTGSRARCCFRRVNWISRNCRGRNPAGSIRISSTPMAMGWWWRKCAKITPEGQPVYLIKDMPAEIPRRV